MFDCLVSKDKSDPKSVRSNFTQHYKFNLMFIIGTLPLIISEFFDWLKPINVINHLDMQQYLCFTLAGLSDYHIIYLYFRILGARGGCHTPVDLFDDFTLGLL